MYTVYNTEAFVLDSKDVMESSRLFFLLTKDFGLVLAHAQGVRETKSKLRFSLQPLSHTQVSLVRGRELWRVTGCDESNELKNIFTNQGKAKISAKIFSLLKRLVVDEMVDDGLFSELKSAMLFLEKHDLNSESMENFEIVLVSRILRSLGYWPKHSESFIWNENDLQRLDKKDQIISLINRSLTHSQL